MKKLKFSIITCTYDPKPEHLDRALESMETQTYKNFEHIINDSYSNRITSLLLQDYIKRNKKKYPIKFFQTKPKGVAKALNDASKVASGELIHFLHSDDYYLDKNSLKRASSYFTKDTNWITGNFIFNFKDKKFRVPVTKLLKLNPKRVLQTFIFISHENTFMHTSLLKKYGGFNEKVKGPVEYRLWLRMIQEEELKLVNDAFTVFAIHKNSTSRGSLTAAIRSIKECIRILKEEKVPPFISPGDAMFLMKNKFFHELNKH
jgi:glycosyltransferase